jgi:hypothetical protein
MPQSSNPYTSPLPIPTTAARDWFAFVHRLCGPIWWGGTALIALSWFDIVSARVGWIGFAIAGSTVLISYALASRVGQRETCVILNSQLLQTKDDRYRSVMSRFQNGDPLLYDGFAFALRGEDEIACAMVSSLPASEADEESVGADAKLANSVFKTLQERSEEFSNIISGKSFRVSVLSSFESDAFEICRVHDEALLWQPTTR